MSSDAPIATLLPGSRLYLIDDEGVVFSRDRQELYALNTAATYLWFLIEGGLAEDQVLRDYAAAFAVSDATAAAHVAGVLENFQTLGLIDAPGGTAPPATPVSKPRLKPEAEISPPMGVPPMRDATIVAQRIYRLLNTDFVIRYSNIEQANWIDPILRNFTIPDGPDAPEPVGTTIVIDVQHDGADIFLYRAGQPVGKCDGLDALAPMVKSCLWTSAINNFDYFLNLHTGVLGHRQGCVLLPAAAGSGKSSTTAALVHAGFPYLSDEVALLGQDCTVRSLPLALCFKDTGWGVVSRYFKEIDLLPAHRRSDGKIVKYLSLPEQQCADATQGYQVRAIIFPKYTPGAANTCEPLPKTQALDRLFRECVSIPGRLSERNVSRLVEWIKNIDCHTLEFSDLDAATEIIHDILDT